MPKDTTSNKQTKSTPFDSPPRSWTAPTKNNVITSSQGSDDSSDAERNKQQRGRRHTRKTTKVPKDKSPQTNTIEIPSDGEAALNCIPATQPFQLTYSGEGSQEYAIIQDSEGRPASFISESDAPNDGSGTSEQPSAGQEAPLGHNNEPTDNDRPAS
ncbi:hypothetical protein BGX21_004637, partial [Mortierella sp. AD011]